MVETVTFSEDVGGDGTIITADRHPQTGINGGMKMVRLVKCLEQTVAVAKFVTENAAPGSGGGTGGNSQALDSTDDLAEGENHLYFTGQRAIDAVAHQQGLADAAVLDAAKAYSDSQALDSTDNLAEGENHLYFTEQRAIDAVAHQQGLADAAVLKSAKDYSDSQALDSTDDLAEGSEHLYFTGQRAIDAVAHQQGLADAAVLDAAKAYSDSQALDSTDDLAEGSEHLYFTGQRAIDAVAHQQGLADAAVLDAAKAYSDSQALSTTDELDEGETHLYFTGQRAIDALKPELEKLQPGGLSPSLAPTFTFNHQMTGTVPTLVGGIRLPAGSYSAPAALMGCGNPTVSATLELRTANGTVLATVLGHGVEWYSAALGFTLTELTAIDCLLYTNADNEPAFIHGLTF